MSRLGVCLPANSSAARSGALSGCTVAFVAARLDAAGRFAAGRFAMGFLALTLAAGRFAPLLAADRFAAGFRITARAIATWDRETKARKNQPFWLRVSLSQNVVRPYKLEPARQRGKLRCDNSTLSSKASGPSHTDEYLRDGVVRCERTCVSVLAKA